MTWDREKARAIESLGTLVELMIDAEPGDRRLIAAYLEAKRVLAKAFQALHVERYSGAADLGEVKSLLERAMATNYSGLPPQYLNLRGFGAVHDLIFAYLKHRVGQDVSADELRMLTGDAVHTERRARDLRVLGLQL